MPLSYGKSISLLLCSPLQAQQKHEAIVFQYQDGHTMITVGGMIGSNADNRRLSATRLVDRVYYRADFSSDPYVIRVPRLTRKERLYLDSHMPCEDDWLPSDFELSADDVRAYREVYRFLPSYGELLM